ncbi:hypothetical protein QB910_000146 [Dabrowskivirus KKP3916]|uniref:Uncharacterized protein n=1 Tax=Alicyclobacillus phage KKP_3916 TaxID=3040651 RepID=A0AAT9V7W6_9CAUD|nr:hypothetical protein QB910_000146 [Alicyclobacillus phage KKP 3916]
MHDIYDYIVWNRRFENLEEAKKYCDLCDFEYDIIQRRIKDFIPITDADFGC